MKVQAVKFNTPYLYRGHLVTVKNVKQGKSKTINKVGNPNQVFTTHNSERKFILSNGLITKARHLSLI